MDHSEGFVHIAALDSLVEAQVLGSVLEQRGVPHRIRSFRDTAYDGLFQAQRGWGEVEAAPADAEQIREILADLRNAQPPATE